MSVTTGSLTPSSARMTTAAVAARPATTQVGDVSDRGVHARTRHPQQGYHVKLTIHAPGSQGADTKHKVFWVEPCETARP